MHLLRNIVTEATRGGDFAEGRRLGARSLLFNPGYTAPFDFEADPPKAQHRAPLGTDVDLSSLSDAPRPSVLRLDRPLGAGLGERCIPIQGGK